MNQTIILYGSQTGNAENIAKIIAKKYILDIQPLSFIGKNIEKLNEWTQLFIILSTSGNGDPPDNALKFMRNLKKKHKNGYKFKHLDYCVLALGSTDYTYFCKPGKLLNKLLEEMGCSRSKDIVLIDDSLNDDTKITQWITDIGSYLQTKLNPIPPGKSIKGDNKHLVKVVNKNIYDSYGVLLLEFKDDVIWHPGQNVKVYKDNIPKFYSIASSQNGEYGYSRIQLVFTIKGSHTQWFTQLLPETEIEVSITEPNPFMFIEKKQSVHMICIGSGISVMIGLLSHYYNEFVNTFSRNRDFLPTINLYFGCKSPDKIVGENLLKKYREILTKVEHSFSSQCDPYIQNKINKNDIDIDDTIYICGNLNMVNDIKNKFNKNKIIHEIW